MNFHFWLPTGTFTWRTTADSYQFDFASFMFPFSNYLLMPAADLCLFHCHWLTSVSFFLPERFDLLFQLNLLRLIRQSMLLSLSQSIPWNVALLSNTKSFSQCLEAWQCRRKRFYGLTWGCQGMNYLYHGNAAEVCTVLYMHRFICTN